MTKCIKSASSSLTVRGTPWLTPLYIKLCLYLKLVPEENKGREKNDEILAVFM